MKIYFYFLFAFLALFTPLAFGGSEPWGLLVFNILCIGTGCFILFKRNKFSFNNLSLSILGLLSFIVILSFIQLLSQHTFLQKPSFFPFTLCRYYSLEGLSLLFSLSFFYFALTQLIESSKEIKTMAWFLAGSAVLVSLIGITWHRGEYIGLLTGTHWYNSFGPFTSRNNGSQFVMASFFISLIIWLPHFLLDKKRRFPNNNLWAFTFSAILFIGVFFTHSRGGVIALCSGLFVLCFLGICFFIKSKKSKILYSLLSFCIFSGLIFLLVKYSSSIGLRQFGSFSDKSRLLLYGAAFDMLKDFPWTGVGFDAFSAAIDAYLKVSLKAFPRYLHSDWLELLLSFGYIYGTLIFIWIGLLIVKISRLFTNLEPKKKLRLAIICAGLTGFSFTGVIDFPFHLPACAILFFCLLGFASAKTFDKNIKSFKIPLFLKIILLCLSCVLIVANILYFKTWRNFLFAKKLSPQVQVERVSKDIGVYPSPIFIRRFLLSNYKNSQSKSFSDEERQEIKEKTHKLAADYLKKYPRDKEISQFFLITK